MLNPQNTNSTAISFPQQRQNGMIYREYSVETNQRMSLTDECNVVLINCRITRQQVSLNNDILHLYIFPLSCGLDVADNSVSNGSVYRLLPEIYLKSPSMISTHLRFGPHFLISLHLSPASSFPPHLTSSHVMSSLSMSWLHIQPKIRRVPMLSWKLVGQFKLLYGKPWKSWLVRRYTHDTSLALRNMSPRRHIFLQLVPTRPLSTLVS